MTVEQWRNGGEYFEFGEHKIFYRATKSEKETLLCLHGFPTSSHDYHKIWDSLSERFSLVAFDMIGYGLSAKPYNFDYTTFNQVDILQALIAHLKISKLHIFSHDYGNTIVQELLARIEESRLDFEIEKVCFMNGALFPETHRPILAQKILISPIGPLFGRLIPDSKFKQSLGSVFGKDTQPTPQEFEDFMCLFKRDGGRKLSHRLIQYMREREKYRTRWVGALERMTNPFRLIIGLEDVVSGSHLLERFREVLPHQKDIIELPGIAHFPHFEVPEVTLKHFFDFHK